MNTRNRALSREVRIPSLDELASEYQQKWTQIRSIMNALPPDATPEQIYASMQEATPYAQRLDVIRRPLAAQGYSWNQGATQWQLADPQMHRFSIAPRYDVSFNSRSYQQGHPPYDVVRLTMTLEHRPGPSAVIGACASQYGAEREATRLTQEAQQRYTPYVRNPVPFR